MYIADTGNHRIRKVDRAGIITTIAGIGEPEWDYGFSGDGGPATEAMIGPPWDVAVGPDGSIYTADCGNERIRNIDAAGMISTVAGDGFHHERYGTRFTGDGGLAVKASLGGPSGVAVGPDGTVYIADTGNDRIRKVCP